MRGRLLGVLLSTCAGSRWHASSHSVSSWFPSPLQSLKEAQAGEAARLATQLAALQRQRDDALAEQSFAREEARVAAASQERAVAAAATAQALAQSERDAVMQSLKELQVGWASKLELFVRVQQGFSGAQPAVQLFEAARFACKCSSAALPPLQVAFSAAEGKRAAEMRRLRQVAEERQRDAEAMRALLVAADAARRVAAEQAAAVLPAPAAVAVRAQQPGRRAPMHAVRISSADMEGDTVLLQSVDSVRDGGHDAGGALPAAPLPLQPARLAVNAAAAAARQPAPRKPPHSAAVIEGGWSEGYLTQFDASTKLWSPSGTKPPRSSHDGGGGGGATAGGLLAALSGSQRRLVVRQDENSGSRTVARYDRFGDGST